MIEAAREALWDSGYDGGARVSASDVVFAILDAALSRTARKIEITADMIDRAATELALCGIAPWYADVKSCRPAVEGILRAAIGLPNSDP